MQTHFENIYKNNSMDAVSLIFWGAFLITIFLELAAEEQIIIKEIMVLFTHSCVCVCVCVCATTDMFVYRILLWFLKK